MVGAENDPAGTTQTKHDWLVDQLRKLIRQLPPGSALPPERSLAAEFAMARMTIRQALSVLERNGEVERRQGAGTFASVRKLDHKLRITSFTEDIKQLGMSPSTINLGGGKRVAGEDLAAKLGIPPELEVWNLGRLRLADDLPIAIEWVSIPVDVVPGAELQDLQRESLYDALRSHFGLSLAGGRQRIETRLTDADESALLRVPTGSPALIVDRVVWGADHKAVEHTSAIYRGDRYAFTASLQVEK